jgi:quercetin dioxygenase-like cupin family protein
VSGEGGHIESEGGKLKQCLKPGDWALIPAGAEHREVNEGDTDVVWVIVRAPGGVPQVVNLTGWGGTEVK